MMPPPSCFHGRDSIKPKAGGKRCVAVMVDYTRIFGGCRLSRRLNAKLLRQQVVLFSDPTWDEEAVDEHPDDRNEPANDGERQDQLCDGDAGAPQIKIMAAEPPQEDPHDIRDHRDLLVGIEQDQYARVVGQTAALVDLVPYARGKVGHRYLLARVRITCAPCALYVAAGRRAQWNLYLPSLKRPAGINNGNFLPDICYTELHDCSFIRAL